MHSVSIQILDKAKKQINLDFDEEIKFQIVSHPYSRAIVIAMCEHYNLDWSKKLLNKRIVEFTVKAKPEFENIIKKFIKQVNSSGGTSADKYDIVMEFVFGLGGKKLQDSASDKRLNGVLNKAAIDKDLKTPPPVEKPDTLCCPSCFSESFIKNGKNAKKLQKYKCKDCSNNFTEEV